MAKEKEYAILFAVNEIENVDELDYDCSLEPISIISGSYSNEYEKFIDDLGVARFLYEDPAFLENSEKYVVGEIRTIKDIREMFPNVSSILELKKLYFEWVTAAKYYCKYNQLTDAVDIVGKKLTEEGHENLTPNDVKNEDVTILTELDFELIASIDDIEEMKEFLSALINDSRNVNSNEVMRDCVIINSSEMKKLLDLDLPSIKQIVDEIHKTTKKIVKESNNNYLSKVNEALRIYFEYFELIYNAIQSANNIQDVKRYLKEMISFCKECRDICSFVIEFTNNKEKFADLMVILNVYVTSINRILKLEDLEKIKELYHSLYAETYEGLKLSMKELVLGEVEKTVTEKVEKPKMVSKPTKSNDINDMIDKVEKSMTKLNQMIGLEKVKKQINTFKNLKIYENIANDFIKQEDNRINMVFYGNPGTGKTTVARLLGEIFYALGYTKTAKVTECTASDLIGEYVGHTGPKTKKLFNANRGGIIFIDEAYGLVSKGNNSFSDDAIVELLKEFEKGEIIFILAGYRDEMKTFIDSNPGLKNRINYYFDYEDYTIEELYDIFKQKIASLKSEHSDMGYVISDSVEKEVLDLIKIGKTKKYFSNGRFIDNLVKTIISSHANRIVEQQKFTKEDILTITSEDVTEDSINNLDLKEKVKKIGF